ncbi:MAG: ribosome silencing factor [Elusimicrobia bacterium RIFOXYD12_FULL_66_9]|nr:MAG: ribosome silencing factor [Elusimicrobia bacterium RIFOXYD12_FULL_66_9]
MARTFKTLAVSTARTIDGKKAEQVVVLDVRKSSSLVDFLVIGTALSRPHLEALEHQAEEGLLHAGLEVHHRSRPRSDSWRVLDFGGLMVHLMTAEARELYDLEKLNDDAKEVSWRN